MFCSVSNDSNFAGRGRDLSSFTSHGGVSDEVSVLLGLADDLAVGAPAEAGRRHVAVLEFGPLYLVSLSCRSP